METTRSRRLGRGPNRPGLGLWAVVVRPGIQRAEGDRPHSGHGDGENLVSRGRPQPASTVVFERRDRGLVFRISLLAELGSRS